MTDSAIHIIIFHFLFILFLFISKNKQLQCLAMEHQAFFAIWCSACHQTIKLLKEHKHKVSKIVRDVRMAKIASSATSLVFGGSLTIIGLFLIRPSV